MSQSKSASKLLYISYLLVLVKGSIIVYLTDVDVTHYMSVLKLNLVFLCEYFRDRLQFFLEFLVMKQEGMLTMLGKKITIFFAVVVIVSV